MAQHRILPSGSTAVDVIARELALLVGPIVDPADGSIAAIEFRATAGAISGVRSTRLRAIDQAHPSTAEDLLSELEAQVGLADGADMALGPRRLRLLAKYRALRQGTETAITKTVVTLEPTAVLTGVSHSTALGAGYPRATFRFAVTVPVATFDGSTRALIFDAVEQQKPAYTECRVTTRIGFRCDDPLSRCDDTLLST